MLEVFTGSEIKKNFFGKEGVLIIMTGEPGRGDRIIYIRDPQHHPGY